MSLKKCAKIFGTVLFLLGLLGCIPGMTSASLLLGIFLVNHTVNGLHLATGVIAYGSSRLSFRASKLFFQICGIVYLALALLGLSSSGAIFGLLANNSTDSWLHFGVSLISLYLGFLYRPGKQ